MTVYVYKLAGQRPRPFTVARPPMWFGLTADNVDELHSFAESLGLQSALYRPRHSGGVEVPMVGHYDLAPAERDRAMAAGATAISTRQATAMLQQQAAALGIRLD